MDKLYDISYGYTTKIKNENGEETENTIRNVNRKIKFEELQTKINEAVSSVPEDVERFYLEVYVNWDSEMNNVVY